MTSASSPPDRFRVVIVGGGVAALEAALALRDLGHACIVSTIVTPDPEFTYRPMTVREPFGYAKARKYPLAQIAQDIGADLYADRFSWLDARNRLAHTEAGRALPYDALLLALGARTRPRFKHVLTIDDKRIDELLHGLIQDIEGGYLHRLAFVIPSGKTWPLPVYELALMMAACAHDADVELSITIATPEDAPLAIFGREVSEGIRELLEEHGIMTITSAHCEIHEPGRIAIHPGSRHLHADRIVALPELVGPSTRGVPGGPRDGFIPVDVRCRVPGLERVYAAGDATNFAIKHGGIAAQQADIAAQAIAFLAGVASEPAPFHPVISGVLLTGGRPRYLSAHVTGGHGSDSQITEDPTSSPAAKISAKYLAPYLAGRDRLAAVA